jgi:hypothetical protein
MPALAPRIAALLDAYLSSDPQTRPRIAELLEALEHASVAATAASSDFTAA